MFNCGVTSPGSYAVQALQEVGLGLVTVVVPVRVTTEVKKMVVVGSASGVLLLPLLASP